MKYLVIIYSELIVYCWGPTPLG